VNEQSKLLPTRVPWRQFPEVIVHSSIHKLKSAFGYFSAKRGNHQTALRIAHALVKQPRTELSIDFIVPVIQVDQGHYNAIPVALAAVLAEHLGAKLWLDVCQVNKVNHTGANALDRLRNQPVFGGTVPTGRCLICDDVVTFGASLANLRGFLVSNGAEVVAATVIGAAYGSTKLAPDCTLIGQLRDRYDREIETQTAALGFGCECLTAREAYFLAGLRTTERFRNRLAQGVRTTDRARGATYRI
jgi:hypothetical protein